MRFRILACSLVILVVAAVAAEAGTMTATLQVKRAYDLGFVPFIPIMDGARVANGQPGYYEIAVQFTTANKTAAEKGWLSTLFDLNVANNAGGSNLQKDFTIAGWTRSNHNEDTNGLVPGGGTAIFGTNQDAGTPGDLLGILANLGGGATVPDQTETGGSANIRRNNLGLATAPSYTDPGAVASVSKGAGYADPNNPADFPVSNVPTWLGSFWVQWNGLGTGDLNLSNLQYAFSLYNGDTDPLNDTAGPSTITTGTHATQGFGSEAIPEPATISLFGLAMVGFAGLIRRRK